MAAILAVFLAIDMRHRAPERPPLFTTDVRALAEVDDALRGKSVESAVKQAEMIATFRAFTARYPTDSFVREVRRVVLVTDLEWRGQPVGGLADSDRRTIAVEVGERGTLYERDWLRRSLHHEVAHVVLDRNAGYLVQSLWLRSNAKGFRYRYADGLEALKANRAGSDTIPIMNAQGLLDEYAASCYEEDLASVASELLSDDVVRSESRTARGHVYDLARRYPRLGAKLAQMRAFYSAVFWGIRLPTLPEPWGASQ